MIKNVILLLMGGVFFFSVEAKADRVCFENKFCYDVDVMQTLDELRQGLMFVKSMSENRGMLFDFRAYERKGISMWMKNTFIPLDMLFIGCDGELKDIYRNARPHSLDSIKSESDFCYVVEVNGGEADKRGLKIRDKVDIDFGFMTYIKAFWNGVY